MVCFPLSTAERSWLALTSTTASGVRIGELEVNLCEFDKFKGGHGGQALTRARSYTEPGGSRIRLQKQRVASQSALAASKPPVDPSKQAETRLFLKRVNNAHKKMLDNAQVLLIPEATIKTFLGVFLAMHQHNGGACTMFLKPALKRLHVGVEAFVRLLASDIVWSMERKRARAGRDDVIKALAARLYPAMVRPVAVDLVKGSRGEISDYDDRQKPKTNFHAQILKELSKISNGRVKALCVDGCLRSTTAEAKIELRWAISTYTMKILNESCRLAEYGRRVSVAESDVQEAQKKLGPTILSRCFAGELILVHSSPISYHELEVQEA